MIKLLNRLFDKEKDLSIDKPIGINLTSLSDIKLTNEMIEEFIEICFEFFKAHEIEPTYWHIPNKALTSKLQKFTQRKLKNLKEKKEYRYKDGDLINGIAFVINPKDSDAPAYDGYLYISLRYSLELKETRIITIINPKYIPLQPNEIKWFMEKFTSLFTPDFGYVYEHEDYEHVNARVGQYNDGKRTHTEEMNVSRWYTLPREEKKKTLIEPFIVNILRRELFKDTIEKLLEYNKEFLDYYKYSGECFKEANISNKELACIVKESYFKLCE